jgi:NACHT domain
MHNYPTAPQNTLNLIVETAIATTIVGLIINKFLPAVWKVIIRPFLRVGKALWRWVGPRNPLNLTLRTYKKNLRKSDLAYMENPVGPALKVPLQEAFAPLKIVSTAAPQGIELFPFAAEHQRFIVLGGPGTGKTTLMKSLVINILNGSCHPVLNKLIPAFVPLRKLSSRQQDVTQAIISTFADHNFPGATDFVEALLGQGRLLVVLDGLDEVGQNRETVAGQIQEFCERDSQREHPNWIVVTCRENSYRNEDLQGVLPNVVRVEPFANHHMRVFLEGWPPHLNRVAIGLYSLIQGDPQIRDVCRNPLLLTILTGLYLDSGEFDLPSSRERFYSAAVDELLLKRPARRNIRQNFSDKDKRRVLNEISLERLESVLPQEDSEELTDEALRSHARKVISSDTKIEEFIKELLEVNGIIRETGAGVYTTSHRTFQEYFAACEAQRVRVPDNVLDHFTERADLIEVLYFYCGLLRNLPQLTDIAERLAARSQWEIAGRCLLNMGETLQAKTIETVVNGLSSNSQLSRLGEPTLEILASLAQRSGSEYDLARQRFDEVIDSITVGSGQEQASDLGSALAATPSVAMRVIPALLGHKSESLRITAITLLRDLGTDEGLDQLVRLLGEKNRSERPYIGFILAGLMKTRAQKLAQRAVFLPERQDKLVWPLDDYFPARLAIPIAEAVAMGSAQTGIPSIDYAAAIISGRTSDQASLKQWRNAPSRPLINA